MNQIISEAQNEIDNVRSKCIGLFKHNLSTSVSLVIEKGNNTVATVSFTPLGAIHHSFCMPIESGKLSLFPDGINMLEMISKPFEWNDFYQKFRNNN